MTLYAVIMHTVLDHFQFDQIRRHSWSDFPRRSLFYEVSVTLLFFLREIRMGSQSNGSRRTCGDRKKKGRRRRMRNYSHTTSILQDVSRKSPVTFGFSALQVTDFPSSSTPGTNSTLLIVRFSPFSSWKTTVDVNKMPWKKNRNGSLQSLDYKFPGMIFHSARIVEWMNSAQGINFRKTERRVNMGKRDC